MKHLLNIREENGKSVVSARELYEFLGVKRDFTNWCKQMFDYGFQEDTDFTPILAKSTKGRPSVDYALSINCAKEISMIQRTEKGKEARQYFIECESRLQKVQCIIESAQQLTPEQMVLSSIQYLEQTVAMQKKTIANTSP